VWPLVYMAKEARFRVCDHTVHEVRDPVPARPDRLAPRADDPAPFADEWHVRGFGVHEARRELGLTGKGVRVAVIDTGVLLDHPELRDRTTAADYSSEGANDENGHGTHCCGIVAAVAPAAHIVSIKVFDREGYAVRDNINRALADILAGVYGNVRVVNMSLGGGQPCETMRMLLLELNARGVALVCAAGNESSHDKKDAPRFGTVNWPAHFSSTLAVGSVDRRRERSEFSSTGPKIAVMAPGEMIVSAWKNGGHAVLSGTSMASPFVAGCLALLVERCAASALPQPDLGKLLWALAASSEDMEASGSDFYTGDGLIRPKRLVERYEELCSKSADRAGTKRRRTEAGAEAEAGAGAGAGAGAEAEAM
jgi:subtilisin